MNDVTTAVNTGVDFVYGYNPSTGQWGDNGSFLHAGSETLGQINGTNAARHAQGVAGDAQLQAQANANTLLTNENKTQQQSDVQASSGAAGIRATAKAQAAGAFSPGTTTPLALGPGPTTPAGSRLGSDQQTFLGL